MKKELRYILIFLVCWVSISLNSEESRFLIGVPDNNQISKFYKALTLKAYANIGMSVEFVEVGAERGLILLNKGITDADTMRFLVVSERYENLIPILPPLTEGELRLYCAASLKCEANVVNDPDNDIVALKSVLESAKLLFPEYSFDANILSYESQQQIERIVFERKVNYVLLAIDGKYSDLYETLGYQSVSLGSATATHFIHKKHAHLAEELSASFHALLSEQPVVN